MLDVIQKAVGMRLPSVAVAAFRTAIHQQEAIEEAAQALRESEREARAERQRDVRDEVVGTSENAGAPQTSESDSDTSSDTDANSDGQAERGNAVDVKV